MATIDWRGSGRLEVEGAGPAAGLSCAHDEACSLLVAAIGPAGPRSASELLARYRSEGEDAIKDLGAGVVAIVSDKRSEVVAAARDATGIHPLFHSAQASRIRISPFSDALLARQEHGAQVDRIVIVASLLDLWGDPERTFFKGISRVPAGCVVRIERGRAHVLRWWHPPYPDETVERESFATVVRRTVRGCADGETHGVLLSGGLDSACVASALSAEARALKRAPPSALSLQFPGTETDETDTQRAVAAALRMPHLAMDLDEAVESGTLMKQALALAPRSVAPPGLLQPAYDALLIAARERGIRIVLTGDGGDEWLMPPPTYAADRLRALDAGALLRLGQAWNAYWPGSTPSSAARAVLWHSGMRPLAAMVLRSSLAAGSPRLLRRFVASRVRRWNVPWLADDARLRSEISEWVAGSPRPALSGLAEDDRRSLLEHPNLSLMYEEAFGTRERLGITTRMPLLEPELVADCLSQPIDELVAGGRAKAPARALLSGVPLARDWPRTVYGNGVLDAVVERERAAAWRSIGEPGVLAALQIVDSDAAKRVSHARMWDIIAWETWLQSRITGDDHGQ